MTLQSSGAIKASQIKTEFSGSNPMHVSGYYKGGALVPNTSINSHIPTSGAIKYSEFYGGSANITFALFAASGFTQFGNTTSTGYGNAANGGLDISGSALTPNVVFTFPVGYLMTQTVVSQAKLIIRLKNAPTQNSFASVSFVDNHSVSRTFLTSSPTSYSGGIGFSDWTWNLTYEVFTAGGSYTLSFT